MKYRLIETKGDSITVILEDGGIADIHYAEPYDDAPNRKSVTEYYQTRFTQEDLESDEELWTILGEGKMYYNEWTTDYDDPAHVQDALNWLAVEETFELDESIWPDFAF
jgi:hypothetical protein